MGTIILSIILYVGLFVFQWKYEGKINNLPNKINLLSLAIFAFVAIVAGDKIENREMKLIYSLGLVVSSGVGRYGTMITKKKNLAWKISEYTGFRYLIYHILFISGVLGLVF